MTFPIIRLHPFYNADAYLVEQIEWDGNENQRHQVGRGDDGSHQHNDDKRMLAIVGQHTGGDDAHLAKKEGYDGQLEHHTHHQRQRHEGGNVRIERDVAHHPCRHAVSAEKAEGDGEQHEVGLFRNSHKIFPKIFK